MKIEVTNNTDLPNKYIRLVKWSIYKIKRKFDHLLYAEVHINSEGQSPVVYQVMLKLGVPGNDIVLKEKSDNKLKVWQSMTKSALRYLRKYKDKKVSRRRTKNNLESS